MQLKNFRIVLAIAIAMATTTAVPSEAHAGAIVTHTVGRDDGGYINAGTQGTLGSTMLSTAGKTFCFWIKTVDSGNIISMGSWFAYPSMGPDYGLFMLNMQWTGDYFGLANSVGYYLPTDNATWFFTQATGVNFNDGAYHHHCFAWSGLTSNKPTTKAYYIDGVVTGGSWVDQSDGVTSGTANWGADVWIGGTRKSSSGTGADFASFRLEDFRIYTRGLSADEVKQIYKMRGRDMIRNGLFTRYPFWSSWINTGTYGVAPIPSLDGSGTTPTLETDKLLSGRRRKVMRIDVQRMLERPANEDRHLAEPHLRRAA